MQSKCMAALQYAKLTGHRSVGMPDENGTTMYPRQLDTLSLIRVKNWFARRISEDSDRNLN